jgi:flagellar assembly factor FliW
MPRIQTKYFGEMEYSGAAVYEFPHGLPGFESEHAFLFLEQPSTHPLMFMQSLFSPDVCFILLPVLAADPQYRLNLSDEDMDSLGLPPGGQPGIGEDVLCAVLVCAAAEGRTQPTVNLLAPVLVNLKQQIGIQAIQSQTQYSHRHPLIPEVKEEPVPCS